MRRWRTAGVVLGLVALAGACGDGDDTGAAGDGEIGVVAAFYPLAEAATRVGGDRVAVTNLTAPGVEPHDVELSPRQVDAIEDADVLLYIGAGFQPAVERSRAGSTVSLSTSSPAKSETARTSTRTCGWTPGACETSLRAFATCSSKPTQEAPPTIAGTRVPTRPSSCASTATWRADSRSATGG